MLIYTKSLEDANNADCAAEELGKKMHGSIMKWQYLKGKTPLSFSGYKIESWKGNRCLWAAIRQMENIQQESKQQLSTVHTLVILHWLFEKNTGTEAFDGKWELFITWR